MLVVQFVFDVYILGYIVQTETLHYRSYELQYYV